MAPQPTQITSSKSATTPSKPRAKAAPSKQTLAAARIDHGVIALRYEETKAAKPPIPVTVAPPRRPPIEEHPALREAKGMEESALEGKERGIGDGMVGLVLRGEEKEELGSKRDSGLAPTMSSKAREGSVNTVEEVTHGVTINFDSESPQAIQTADTSTKEPPITPHRVVKKEGSRSESLSKWRRPSSRKESPPKTPDKAVPDEEFSPITTPIPTDGLLEENFLEQISFSKRGSMMLGGKKAVNGHARGGASRRKASFSMLATPTVRILSEDVEKESKKVRSMYETGTNFDWQEKYPVAGRSQIEEEDEPSSPKGPDSLKRPQSALSQHELAGGIEDWEDIEGRDVDRYGFISLRRNLPTRSGTPEPRPPHRVSTVLQLASEMPRQNRVFGRSPSAATSKRNGPKRLSNRKVSIRSIRTYATNNTKRSTSRSAIRTAANRLPGNRNRRWMDEAGDMLTLPPGLADIAEEEDNGKAAASLKKKEWSRTEKWRKMAKIVKTGKEGEGMVFEFDVRNPKLIERTWKGIPDRWRAAAWYSFLSTSAKRRKDIAKAEQIIGAFHQLQDQSSTDDVQIDLDVPRTINSHIMFRRRYRGGQRLLFRVLHALSLYYPDAGYVQGMASLAATLLCYYDEEKTFVMLVWMWTLRGLEKLYEAGFPGLMAALDEFQKQWLDGSDVAKQLITLSIDPTAYGTRWYLTLFNYSIPFPAQLRVWDVFMLLGDAAPSIPASKERPFAGGLDVLHATAAALIDGTREILLDSDFENAMKVLTGWIPVKDEDLLMKVARAEWRAKKGKMR